MFASPVNSAQDPLVWHKTIEKLFWKKVATQTRGEQWPNLTDKTKPRLRNRTEIWTNWRSKCRWAEPSDPSDIGVVTQLKMIFKTDP